MKRKLSIIMICVLLLVTVGTIKAGDPEYSITEYPAVTLCTVDGKFTAPDEWNDTTQQTLLGEDQDFPMPRAEFGYNVQDFTNLGLEWVINFGTDQTDDTGDYWQICLDNGESGGSAPDSGDFMIKIVGHTTLTLYQGNGTGWIEVTPEEGELTWSNTMDNTNFGSGSAANHWILEIVDSSKTSGTLQVPDAPPTGMRVAAYDADANALVSWPPLSSADVPDDWGRIADFSMEPIPEALTFAVMAILSSTALLVGSHYLRKRSKKREK